MHTGLLPSFWQLILCLNSGRAALRPRVLCTWSLLPVALLLLAGSNSFAQWRNVGGEQYEGVAFYKTWYYVCGLHGNLLRSADALSWERVREPFTSMLSMTTTSNHLIIGGINGRMAFSSDAGRTWQQADAGTSAAITRLATVPGTSTIVAGCANGEVLRSIDEGETWSAATVQAASTAYCKGFSFSSSLVGYFSTDIGGLYRTSDGGAHWTSIPSPITVAWGVPLALGDSSLLVGSGAVLFRTSNLGQTWDTSQTRATALLSRNGNTIFAFDAVGVWAASTDYGAKWELHIDSNFWVWQPTLDVTWKDSLHGLRVGLPGLMVKTSDGGRTWEHVALSPMHGRKIYKSVVTSLTEVDTSQLLATGINAMVFSSSNHGETWSEQTLEPWRNPLADLYKILKIGQDTLLTAGDFGSTYRSTDGGASWTYMVQPFTDNMIRDLMKLPSGDVIISGDSAIYKSTNAGATWELLTMPGGAMREITLGEGDTLLGVRVSGAWPSTKLEICRSTDGCAAWAPTHSPILPTAHFLLKYFAFKGWYALGDSGRVFKSSNAGDIWIESTPTGFGRYAHDMLWINDSLGFVATDNMIIRTTNAGLSWTRDSLPLPVLTDGFTPSDLIIYTLARVGSYVIAGGTDNIYQLPLNGDPPLAVRWQRAVPYVTTVWPNPTDGHLRWSNAAEGASTVRMIDATGRVVSKLVCSTPAIDVSQLAPGPYTMIIEQDETTKIAHVIIRSQSAH